MRDFELAADLHRLKGMIDSGRRAAQFEQYLEARFSRERFRVKLDPRGGAGRQIDLMAIGTDGTYLIEAKWTVDKAGVPEIGELVLRLRKMPPHVIGVLVSWTGFSETVRKAVLDERPTQILLITGVELERDEPLGPSLKWKAQCLLEDGEVVIDEQAGRRQEITAALPTATATIVNRDADRATWIATTGGYSPVVFVRELPDIDWVPGSGFGVVVDIRLPALDQSDLLEMIGKLNEMDWMSSQSWWSIQQAANNWHGCGTAAFTELLSSWRERYEGIDELHHTEEFRYVDVLSEGFYSLSGQISAEELRVVRFLHLSIQLTGVPVRRGKVEELCNEFNVDDPIFYRPRDRESVTRIRPNWRVDLEVVGFVTEPNKYEVDEAEREWVVGVVAKNPYLADRDAPEWWPANLEELDQLICPLANWHPVHKPRDHYHLHSCEWAWTSDTLAVRLLADWDDPPEDGCFGL